MAEVQEKLSAAQRAKIRRLSQPREADESDNGELNIVPFLDIITNVLMFVLATVSVTFTATIDSFPPRAGGGARVPTTKTLGLTVIIVPDGFSVKASGGNVAPGCNDAGPGLAIPKKGSEYDYESLRDCAARLKTMAPEFAAEEQVTISANPQIPYQAVISTIDYLREKPDPQDPNKKTRLFPEVNFGLAR